MNIYTADKVQEQITVIQPVPATGRELTDDVKKILIREAMSVLKNSYAPYSHYNVAAAALMDSGKVYTGVNVESSLLSNTICAERNAIFHAAAQGERRLVAIAVVGGLDSSDESDLAQRNYCTPCGVCRQVMRDFADPSDMVIISARSEDDYREWTLEQLLPVSFGPEFLEN